MEGWGGGRVRERGSGFWRGGSDDDEVDVVVVEVFDVMDMDEGDGWWLGIGEGE